MLQLGKDMSLEEYFQNLSGYDKERQMNIYNRTKLSEKAFDRLGKLKTEVDIVVFAEGYCPDCMITLAVLKRMLEVCEFLKVHVYYMYDNETIMEKYSGDAVIPTILLYKSEEEVNTIYLEMPEKLKESDNVDIIIEYRLGKHNEHIETQLLSGLGI